MKYEYTRMEAIRRWQLYSLLSYSCHLSGVAAAIFMLMGVWPAVLSMIYLAWKQPGLKLVVDGMADALNTGTFKDD